MKDNEQEENKNYREIDKTQWNADSFEELKNLGEKLAQYLYPGALSPLIETNDMVGKFLHDPMPYTASAAMPYISLCMHKYPPFELEVDSSLFSKSIVAYNNTESFELELNLAREKGLKNIVLTSLVKKFSPNLYEIKNSESFVQINQEIDKLIHILSDIKLIEVPKLKVSYLSRFHDWKKARRKKLEDHLREVADDELVKYFESFESFQDAFNLFYGQIPFEEKQENQIISRVVKFRFLLHIIILFQRCAGSADADDYTLPLIKKERQRIDEDSLFYKEYRSVLKSMHVNHTQPNKEELESIRFHSNELLVKLYGRTNDHDLLMKLAGLSKSKKDDFCLNGVLNDSRNMDVRAFIKSLASFFCLHNFDLVFLCKQVLVEKDYIKFKKVHSKKINLIVEKICDVFYLGFSKEKERIKNKDAVLQIIKKNTKDILSQMYDQVEKYFSLSQINIPNSYLDSDLDVLHDFLGSAYPGIKVKNSTLLSIKENLKGLDTIDEKVNLCGRYVLNSSGLMFWDDPFAYTGMINQASGRVSLIEVIPPIFNDIALSNALHGIKRSLLSWKKEF